MTECNFCDKEFDSKEDLHIHWGEEHEDELNSHQKEKVKKAERKQEEKKQKKMAKRKKLGGQLLAGTAALIVVGLLGFQFMQNSGGTTNSGSFDLEGQPFVGDENASVTVVEFADYRCPYCKQFDEQIYPQLEDEYIESGDVKFYMMNYAFLGPGSTQAAAAGECVYEQDEEQFWDFHHAIYDNQGSESENWINQEFLMNLARDNTEGLDYDELESCISSQETLSEVQSDKRQGDQNGVGGTPTVFVNGEQIQNSMSYGSIKAAIEQELSSDE